VAEPDDPLARPLPPPTWRDLLDRVVAPDRAARLRVVLAVVALAAAGLGVWWLLRAPAPATELSLPYAPGAGADAGAAPVATGATTTSAPAPVEVVVHAAGAVVTPGVHRVAAGGRVADLLAAAGGPAVDADLDRVNLAAPLVDGQRVWFPRIGEAAPPPVPGEGGPAPPAPDGASAAAPLDLNAATADQLETLPGIGPSIAAAIVEHRDRRGPFRTVDDLLDVAGIGPARLEELRELVTV
jgi:competence protein ComEA